jgi:hypothetical protein
VLDALTAAPQVTAADDQGHFDAQVPHLFDFAGDLFRAGGVNAVTARPGQRLAAELEQDAMVCGSRHRRGSSVVNAAAALRRTALSGGEMSRHKNRAAVCDSRPACTF